MTGAEFKAIRLELGLSQAKLAAELDVSDVSDVYICVMEKGNRPVTGRVALAIECLVLRRRFAA